MNIHDWRRASAEERRVWVGEVSRSHPELRWLRNSGELEVPVFLHEPTDGVFLLVPGGQVTLGMDADEHERARDEAITAMDRRIIEQTAAAGTVEVTLKSFLISVVPLGGPSLKAMLAGGPWLATERQLTPAAPLASMSSDEYLSYLSNFSAGCLQSEREVDLVQSALQRASLDLPSEAQWEHAARAGLHSLFPNGNEVPGDPNIGPNPLGLMNLGAEAELCADSFSRQRAGAPADGSARRGPNPRVVRGGSACCYPWQNCAEWTLHLCAARSDGQDLKGFWVVRPVLSW